MYDIFIDKHYYTLCTPHSLPPSPVREMREGVPGRSQLPSGAVFSCNLTGELIGLKTSLSWPPSCVCRGYGQQVRFRTEWGSAHPAFEGWCWHW